MSHTFLPHVERYIVWYFRLLEVRKYMGVVRACKIWQVISVLVFHVVYEFISDSWRYIFNRSLTLTLLSCSSLGICQWAKEISIRCKCFTREHFVFGKIWTLFNAITSTQGILGLKNRLQTCYGVGNKEMTTPEHNFWTPEYKTPTVVLYFQHLHLTDVWTTPNECELCHKDQVPTGHTFYAGKHEDGFIFFQMCVKVYISYR